MGHCIPVIASFQENGGCTNFTRFLEPQVSMKEKVRFVQTYIYDKQNPDWKRRLVRNENCLFILDRLYIKFELELASKIEYNVFHEIIRYSSVLYNLKLCYSWHEFRKKKDFENLKFSQLKNLSSRLTKLGHESIFKSSFIAPKQQTIDIIISMVGSSHDQSYITAAILVPVGAPSNCHEKIWIVGRPVGGINEYICLDFAFG